MYGVDPGDVVWGDDIDGDGNPIETFNQEYNDYWSGLSSDFYKSPTTLNDSLNVLWTGIDILGERAMPSYGWGSSGNHDDIASKNMVKAIQAASGCPYITGYYGNITMRTLSEFITPQGTHYTGLVVGQSLLNRLRERVALLSNSELIYLARTIYGEARGENWASKVAVGWVIRNRVESWGKTYEEVVTSPKQFSCWNTDDVNYDNIMNPKGPTWVESLRAAQVVMFGAVSNPVPGIKHYYSPDAMIPKGSRPKWSSPEREIKLQGIPHFVFVKMR